MKTIGVHTKQAADLAHPENSLETLKRLPATCKTRIVPLHRKHGKLCPRVQVRRNWRRQCSMVRLPRRCASRNIRFEHLRASKNVPYTRRDALTGYESKSKKRKATHRAAFIVPKLRSGLYEKAAFFFCFDDDIDILGLDNTSLARSRRASTDPKISACCSTSEIRRVA